MFIDSANESPQGVANYPTRLDNAFEAAAFLANQFWLTSAFYATRMASHDAGTSTQVPDVSTTDMVIVSAFLSIRLFALPSMALTALGTHIGPGGSTLLPP